MDVQEEAFPGLRRQAIQVSAAQNKGPRPVRRAARFEQERVDFRGRHFPQDLAKSATYNVATLPRWKPRRIEGTEEEAETIEVECLHSLQAIQGAKRATPLYNG